MGVWVGGITVVWRGCMPGPGKCETQGRDRLPQEHTPSPLNSRKGLSSRTHLPTLPLFVVLSRVHIAILCRLIAGHLGKIKWPASYFPFMCMGFIWPFPGSLLKTSEESSCLSLLVTDRILYFGEPDRYSPTHLQVREIPNRLLDPNNS